MQRRFILFGGFICAVISSISCSFPKSIIMIDQGCDVRKPGRRVVESYERGIAMQVAESLKQAILKRYDVSVVLSRRPGEVLHALQAASFANRLGVALNLSLHIFRQESAKPTVFLYYLIFNPLVDLAHRSRDSSASLAFVPLYQAHFAAINATIAIAESMQRILCDMHRRILDCRGPFGVPFKPLVGMVAPAIGIEIGLSNENSWNSLIEPLAASLQVALVA